MPIKTTVTAMDFGTSKIVTLVAENSGTQRCNIVGAGIAPYDGYLEEGWNNPGELDDAIRASISEAEKQCHHKIKEVNVGVPGAFTSVYATETIIDLKGTEPKVTPNDVRDAFTKARESLGNVPGIIVHSSPAWFTIDGGKKTLEPVGIKGQQLKALISFVVANQFFIEDVQNRLSGMEINAVGFYSTPAGEAMLYLPEEDRDRTAVLIDIGYLNTEITIVEGDAVIFHDMIGIGGGHIAADLSIGLEIPLSAAEQIKRQYVYGVETPDEVYDVPGTNGEKGVSFIRAQVSEVIEPRVEEICEEIKKSIDNSGVRLGQWSNIYLTGGGIAFNRGGRDFVSKKLALAVRDTPKRTTKLNSHAFSSALGLMDLIIDTIEQQREAPKGIKGFFKDLLKI